MKKAVYVGIFVIGAAMIYWWTSMNSRAEGFASGADYSFVMYGVEWCPHCVSAKPEFKALGSTKTIGGKTVEFVLVNPEKEPEKVRGKVEGFPTFHLYDAQGKLVKEYSGPRKTADFQAFVEKSLK